MISIILTLAVFDWKSTIEVKANLCDFDLLFELL